MQDGATWNIYYPIQDSMSDSFCKLRYKILSEMVLSKLSRHFSCSPRGLLRHQINYYDPPKKNVQLFNLNTFSPNSHGILLLPNYLYFEILVLFDQYMKKLVSLLSRLRVNSRSRYVATKIFGKLESISHVN